jgi:metal-dependent amidase/aminoacylase/carboxypeptidase family protein
MSVSVSPCKLTAELRTLGYEVTTDFGRTAVVGVLKSGAGPVVQLRTELDDAVEEKIQPARSIALRSPLEK